MYVQLRTLAVALVVLLGSASTVNAVDIGFSSLVPLAVAHTKNIPFVIVAPGVL